jgi:phosphoserine phosphatase
MINVTASSRDSRRRVSIHSVAERSGLPMKYVILVGDGMGDYPVPELNGKTPLEAAKIPHMDELAR